MKLSLILRFFLPLCIIAAVLVSCSDDDPVVPTPVPPAVPAHVTTGTITQTSIALAWQAAAQSIQTKRGSAQALAGYTLSYADTTIKDINKEVSSYTVQNLAPNTNYTFLLKAISTDGLASEAAVITAATLQIPVAPAPATGFTTTGIRTDAIDLAWTASTSANLPDFVGYTLSYNGNDVQLAASQTTYTVMSLQENTAYTFALVARSTNGLASEPVSLAVTTQEIAAPEAPTSLTAAVGNSSEVRLRWTASASATEPDFAGYEVSYTPNGGTLTLLNKDQVAHTIGGLQAGTVYTFSVRARLAQGKKGIPATVKWSPAQVSSVFRLYSFKSAMGHGIDLDGDNGNPAVLKIANGEQWDIAFDDRSTEPAIGAPGQSLYVNDNFKFPNGKEAKLTRVSTHRYTNLNSLADIAESSPLDAGTKEQMQLINTTQPFAFIVKTQEGNYAKVLVLSTDGRIVQGSGNDTYIEIQISYQPVPNVPYAVAPGQESSVQVENKPANVLQRRKSR